MSVDVARSRHGRAAGEGVALYRLFGPDRELLYVGISNHPFARMAEHRADKWWFRQIDDYEIEWFDNRDLAADAENLAIWQEAPRYNKLRVLPSTPRGGDRVSRPISLDESLGRTVVALLRQQVAS